MLRKVKYVIDQSEQDWFVQKYATDLDRYHQLGTLAAKVFSGDVPNRAGATVDNADDLRKRPADFVVLHLARVVVDDFNEMLILSANGLGFGALKILRGLYERTVVAAFIHKHPDRAEPFWEDSAVRKEALAQKLSVLGVDLFRGATADEKEAMTAEARRVRDQRKRANCKKCHQPILQNEWTNMPLSDMAKDADHRLDLLYGPCYVEPSAHHHATAFGLEQRLEETDQGFSYKGRVDHAAVIRAMPAGELLAVYSLELVNRRFDLDFANAIASYVAAMKSNTKTSG